MNKKELNKTILSFLDLEKNWDTYDAEKTTIQSIESAIILLESLSNIIFITQVNVFPMRDGGIQFDIGEFKEIEIFNFHITEIFYDLNYKIINKISYELN